VTRTNIVGATYYFNEDDDVTVPTDSSDIVDSSLADTLAELSFLIHAALAEATAGHDLSIIQTRLLGILRDREPTMNELGAHLNLDKSSITGLVDRAERRGLVRRTTSSRDRRAVHVGITDAGREVADRVATKFNHRITAITARLTSADRTRLMTLTTRLLRADPRP
jgi:MarR family transcriptional regulator, lower aerobic nicotinate degradation pathway regulator